MTGPPTALRIERTFDAPAQAVFDAWTSPEVIRRWWHAGEDWETPAVELDLRVGGRLQVTMRDPAGKQYSGGGEFTAVQPPERLAFTWSWAGEEGSPETLVELELDERDGATTVVLTQGGLRDERSRDSHGEGWQNCLDNLERALVA